MEFIVTETESIENMPPGYKLCCKSLIAAKSIATRNQINLRYMIIISDWETGISLSLKKNGKWYSFDKLN